MKVIVAATHCYVGCQVRTEEDGDNSRALVEFGDGAIVLGEFEASDGGGLLTVPGYRTARGTRIATKIWRLEPGGGAGSWRIKARVTAA
jgi:hypothetical protein